MRPELLVAAAEIEGHLDRVQATLTSLRSITVDHPSNVETWAAGALLQALYTGWEATLTRCLRPFDGEPDGAGYHAALLQRAALDVPGLRPAILASTTASLLDPYRRFRHFFRNAYGIDLSWAAFRHLVEQAPAVAEEVERDVRTFVKLLRGA